MSQYYLTQRKQKFHYSAVENLDKQFIYNSLDDAVGICKQLPEDLGITINFDFYCLVPVKNVTPADHDGPTIYYTLDWDEALDVNGIKIQPSYYCW